MKEFPQKFSSKAGIYYLDSRSEYAKITYYFRIWNVIIVLHWRAKFFFESFIAS
jgi:hypothetical protein